MYDTWKTTEPPQEPTWRDPNAPYQSGPVMDACHECGAPITPRLYLCLACERRRDDAFESFEDERHEALSVVREFGMRMADAARLMRRPARP